jgi:LuxR family maltose regulon positive regulatory protein
LIELLILHALTYGAEGNKDRAMIPLERAIHLSEKLGFVRIFSDEGPLMAQLLYQAMSRGTSPDYVQKLLAAFPIDEFEQKYPPASHSTENELVEPLSERETEVIGLISDGLTNQEIASTLYLSLNTVKVHARNIYGKLGVTNRIQAVARARSLGILPPI